MDESYILVAEATQEAMLQEAIKKGSKNAISTDNLCLHDIKMYECNACGEDLPLFRMYKGLIYCTACQSNVENGRSASSKARL